MKEAKPNAFAVAIMIASAGGIALELAFMRVMLIAYWHNLYYLVISAALLGFGAAGTFLTLTRRPVLAHYASFCWLSALLFALFTAGSFHVFSLIPLNMMHLSWNPRQIGYLLLQYLTLFVPFFFLACCLGTAFTARTSAIGRLYAANMIGSGLGAAAAVGLMYVFPAHWLNVVIAAGLFAASALMAVTRKQLFISAIALICSLVVFTAIWPPRQRVSQYKALSYYHQLGDARTLAVRHGPLGRIDVISSGQIHLLPGRSLTATAPVPPQSALIIDGDAVSAMTGFKDPCELACFDETTLALPYHLLSRPGTLIVGAGAGFDVGLALYHKCPEIVALELNQQVIDLARVDFARLTGRIYTRPGVEVIAADARGYLQQTSRQFQLIQIPPLDSFASVAAGVHVLNENYLYTIEAMQLYLKHLQPGGVLCLTRWLRYWPARDGIKLLATAIEAAEQAGLTPVSPHLIAVRSWATITVLISPRPFTAGQVQAVMEFCRRRQFDPVYFPGITTGQTNHHHVLHGFPTPQGEPTAVYYQAARQLLDSAQRREFYDNNLCQVAPATDDKPYFHDFFRWRSLGRLRRLLGDNWMPFIDWGYLILILALVQSVLIAAVCILLPLLLRPGPAHGKGHRLAAMAYFTAIGLAYMLLEISFIQRLALFLAHPIAAVALVLGSFLVFSGLGSLAGHHWCHKPRQVIVWAALAIVGLGLIYLSGWNHIIAVFQSWPWIGRCAVACLLLGPLAFFMGIPFPMGLLQLDRCRPCLIPWAWGVNSFASVLASSLAVCLAISLGHTVVLIIALALYLAVALLSRFLTTPDKSLPEAADSR